jgi:hypothetical protein
MPLKSQEFKKNDIFPSYFTEEDKLMFDDLFEESIIRHPDIYKKNEWILKYAIICYINGVNNRGSDTDIIEVEKLREVYKIKSRVFETPESDEYKNPEKFLINLPDDKLNEKLNISLDKLEEDKND